MAIEDIQQRTEEFLTGQMPVALRAVDYAPQSFSDTARDVALAEAARGEVALRHVRGAADCIYLVKAFGDELLMQLQCNVWRLVVVYRVPAMQGVDAPSLQPRLERWQLGAQHAGWTVGWREAANPHDQSSRYVETYGYAMVGRDFLDSAIDQVYWRTDIVQMTRYFMLEAQRCGIVLSPRQAGFRI